MTGIQTTTNKREIKQEHAIRVWSRFNGNITEICNEIGVTRKTFYEWLKNPSFVGEIKEQEQSLNDLIRSKLIQEALKGNLGAIKFYLVHKDPEFKSDSKSFFMPLASEEMKLEFVGPDEQIIE